MAGGVVRRLHACPAMRPGLVVALALLAGCGVSRAANPGQTDGDVPIPASPFATCQGIAPKVMLAGVDARTWEVSAGPSWQPFELVLRLPLNDSSLASELVVHLAPPGVASSEKQTFDLASPPGELKVEVFATPLSTVGVDDTRIYSSDTGVAQGSLELGWGEYNVSVRLCLVFARQSYWFRPDTVTIFVPNSNIDLGWD